MTTRSHLEMALAKDRPICDADLTVPRETVIGDIGAHAQVRVVILQHFGPSTPGSGRKAPRPFQLPERGDLIVQRNPGLIRDVRVVKIEPLYPEAFPAALASLPDRRT